MMITHNNVMPSPMCRLAAVASYIPEATLSNEDLERQFSEFKASKIEKKVGIRCRRIAASGETALDLGERAAQKLLSRCPEAVDADFLLFCTQSPDHFLPPNACILQKRLSLSSQIGALDYNLGCSGFVYGVALAKGLIAGGIANRVLLVTAETYSKYLDVNDKTDRSIFGDGAAATLISACDAPLIGEFSLGTDGSGADNLIVKNGGMRNIRDGSAGDFLYMNGPEIFNFTIDAVPRLVSDVLLRNRLVLSDIDHFVFHQANKYMLGYLREKIGIPPERFHIDLSETGNTVSASIPILLEKMQDQEVLKTGERIMIVGFGVGYSYAAGIITWV